MNKSHLPAIVAMTLLLTACGGPDGTGSSGSSGTLITCANHSGEATEYYVPGPGEEPPANGGSGV